MESGKQFVSSGGGGEGGGGGVVRGGGGGEGESEPSFSVSSSFSSSSSSPSTSASPFPAQPTAPGVPPLPQHARSASFSFATPSSGLFGSGLIRAGSQPGDLSLKNSMALAVGGVHPLQERVPSFRSTVGGAGAPTRTISPPNVRPSPSPPLPPSSHSLPDPLLGSALTSGGFVGSKSFSAGQLDFTGGKGGGGAAGVLSSFSRSGPPPFRRMSSQDVAPTLDGLRQLARQGSWRGIVEKVKEAHKFLMFHPPDEALAFSAYHVLALMKLRMFGAAADELRSLGDLDDPKYRYESYPEIYHGKRGSLVPFSLRWLYAELPYRLGQTQGTIDRLYDLLARCNAQIDMLQLKDSPWVRRMGGLFASSSDVAAPAVEIDYARVAPPHPARVASLVQGGHVRSRSSPPVFAQFSTTSSAFAMNERGPSILASDTSAGAARRERKPGRSMITPKVPPPPSTGSPLRHDSRHSPEPKGGHSDQPAGPQVSNNEDTSSAQASAIAPGLDLLRVDEAQGEEGGSNEKGGVAEGQEKPLAKSAPSSHERSLSSGSNDFGDFVSASVDPSNSNEHVGNGLEQKESSPLRERATDEASEAIRKAGLESSLTTQGTEGPSSCVGEGANREGGNEECSGPSSRTLLRKELSLGDGIGLEISRALQDVSITSENGEDNADQTWMEADAREDHETGSLEDDNKEGRSRRFLDQWIRRQEIVLFSIINHHLAQKDFLVALKWLKRMLRARPREPVMLSKYGYVRLQMGDVEGARIVFGHVEQVLANIAILHGGDVEPASREKEGEPGSVGSRDAQNGNGRPESHGEVNGGPVGGGLAATLPPALQVLLCRNRGLLMFAMKQYGAAMREFDAALAIDDTDVVSLVNKAICLMYSRDLMGAISVLEDSLQRNPVAMLNETLVLNLCSIYDLASPNKTDKKRMLSAWIMRCAPDDFDLMCTRL